jgi:hypothetical protein
VIAQDHAARPAVRFGIGDRAMKHGSAGLPAMKLQAGDQGQAGVNREAVRGPQPFRGILESGAFA